MISDFNRADRCGANGRIMSDDRTGNEDFRIDDELSSRLKRLLNCNTEEELD